MFGSQNLLEGASRIEADEQRLLLRHDCDDSHKNMLHEEFLVRKYHLTPKRRDGLTCCRSHYRLRTHQFRNYIQPQHFFNSQCALILQNPISNHPNNNHKPFLNFPICRSIFRANFSTILEFFHNEFKKLRNSLPLLHITGC